MRKNLPFEFLFPPSFPSNPNLENLGFQFEKFISDEICINGINGIPNILDMIMDRIDDGDTDGAKDDIRQLQDALLENNVRG